MIEAEHAHLHARLAEIDKATANLVSAIEAGTDPAVINPRLNQLRAEREITTNQLANLAAPDRLTPADIDALMIIQRHFGGMSRSDRRSVQRSSSASATMMPSGPRR
jgi:hypothetical protein